MKIPKVIQRIFSTWKKVGLWIGKKVAWLIMAMVYMVLFAPIALIMKRKYLRERANSQDSYFKTHDASSDSLYEHQF